MLESHILETFNIDPAKFLHGLMTADTEGHGHVIFAAANGTDASSRIP